ncbi:MAG TPA: nucleoside deaminase [Acidimicrobiales bacterium]|nr:nucleoside deaminase [Acidimicrobiales bacterium]
MDAWAEADAQLMTETERLASSGRDGGDRGHAAIGVLGAFVVGRHDVTRSTGDPTAHPIPLVLTELARLTGSWRLIGAAIYATDEPCVMCAGALVAARVDRLVYGVPNPEFGAAGSHYNVAGDPRLGHEISVTVRPR